MQLSKGLVPVSPPVAIPITQGPSSVGLFCTNHRALRKHHDPHLPEENEAEKK